MRVKQSIAALIAAGVVAGGIYEGTVSEGPQDVIRPGEIVSQRTETAVVYDLGDGTRRVEIASRPVHWFDAQDRAWRTIDTTVNRKPLLRRLVSDRDYEVNAGTYTAEFKEDRPWEYKITAGDTWIEWRVPFDSTAAVTVQVEPTASGIKETVTLKDASAPTRLTWGMETNGTFTRRDDGSYVSGKLIIEPPTAWDAKGKALPVGCILRPGVYEVVVDTRGAVFPVTVDPTTSINATEVGTLTVWSGAAAGARDSTAATNEVTTGVSAGQAYNAGTPLYINIRGFLSFSGIPDLQSVSACTLKVDGRNNGSNTDINVQIYTSTYNPTLETDDYIKFDGRQSGAPHNGTRLNDPWNTSSYSADWNNFIFNAAGLAAVTSASNGTLWLAMIGSADSANTFITDALGSYVDFESTTPAPVLSLTYVPSPPAKPTAFRMTPITKDSMKVEWTYSGTVLDSLVLKTWPDSVRVRKLDPIITGADTIPGLSPYGNKKRWMLCAYSSGFQARSDPDSCWTTSEPTTVTVTQPSSRYHEAHSPVYNVARAVTSPDSIGGDVLSSAGWIGQYVDSDKYVWRLSLNDLLPAFTRIISGSIKATGVEDGSTTDFTVNVFRGTWSAGNHVDEHHHHFSGWQTGATAYTGTSLIDTWTTASYGAAITWPFSRAGIDTISAARGDTLRLAILSSRDVAATAPSGSEFIRLQAPYLSLSVDLPDSTPTVFTLTSIDEDSILAAWTDRAHSERGYVLMDVNTSAKLAGTDTLAANTTSARIGGLENNTLYRWYVQAVGGGAHAMVSGADSVYTDAGAPVAMPTLTFPSGTQAKIVVDTTGTSNPEWTEYAIQDSLSGLFVDATAEPETLKAGLGLSDSWGWRTYGGWNGANGDTVTVQIGKTYAFRVKVRSDSTGSYSGMSLLLDAPLDSLSYTLADSTFIDNSPFDRTLLSARSGVSFSTLASGLTVMNFNGTTDLINAGSDWINTKAVTVRIWMRPETAGEGDAGTILMNGKFFIRHDAGDVLAKRLYVSSDGISTKVYSANNAWAANTWKHLVVTRTAAGIVNIYINGVLSGSANQNSGTPAAGTTNVFIGNNSTASATFDGDISYIRVYQGILTAAQISAIYIDTKGAYGL